MWNFSKWFSRSENFKIDNSECEYNIENFLTKSVQWSEEELNLLPKNLKDGAISQNNLITLEEIILKSDNFECEIKFPIDSIRNKTLQKIVSKQILERNVNSVYPIIHEKVLNLCAKFLILKSKFGSNIEKEFYKNMNVLQFIERLLKKRAIVFVGFHDYYVLKFGDNAIKGHGKWELVGTDKEKPPLILKDCLSYDEMKISAFLSVSSYSYFINDGARKNNGIIQENRNNLQKEGIIIGLIGTRLIKPDVMECQEILISSEQNTAKNGYGSTKVPTIHSLFANFYEDHSFLFNNVRYGPENIDRFKELLHGVIFDNLLYAKRLAVTFDTLLLEANHRAKIEGKKAYIHVVGIGLGVWMNSHHQEEVFVDTFGKRLNALAKQIPHISDIHFSYFPRAISCLGYKDGELMPIEGHPHGGINVYISIRKPYEKLQDPTKLLVVSYAWDSNSLPGNEFWEDFICNSSDSATAASSQVSELHNPYINNNVCVDKLMIATYNDGVVPVLDYITKIPAASFENDG